MKDLLKFEYIYALAILIILSVALFVFKDKDIDNMILTALVGALSAITAFFFTKHDPKSNK